MTKHVVPKSWTLHEWGDGTRRSWPEPSVPLWRQGLSVGTWYELSGTNLSAVDPSPTPSGAIGPVAKIVAWNGSCVDPLTSRVYLIGCGGHMDYAGNEVDMLDLEADAPAWVQLIAPSASGDVQSGDYYSDGRPSSTHTYNSQVFVPEVNRAMRFGSGARYSDGVNAAVVDGFDPETNTYDAAGTWTSIPATLDNQQSWAAVRDASTGNVYLNVAHSGTYRLFRWNVASNTWTQLITCPINAYEMCGAYDSIRHQLLFARSGGYARYNIATNTYSSGSIANGGPGNQAGLIYVEATDRYYYRSSSAGGAVREINPTTMASSALATTGGGSIPARQNGCYSAFGYAPNVGCAYYIPSHTGNVWVLPLHEV